MSNVPDETLDHILSFIDDPRDLRAPNLTSKQFSLLVRPHIEYRVIRCTLATTALWKTLSENAILARNVRSIEIQCQYHFFDTDIDAVPPIVPRQFADLAHDEGSRNFYRGSLLIKDVPQLYEAERSLIRAIQNMANLESFTWTREPPMFNSVVDEKVNEDIWTTLRDSCPSLAHLQVVDASDHEFYGDEDYDDDFSLVAGNSAPLHGKSNNIQPFESRFTELPVRPVHHSALWALPQNLTSFSYHTYAYRECENETPVDELTTMLRRCSNLESLSLLFTLYPVQVSDVGLDVSTANLNDLLANTHWPKLHTFHTASVHVSSSTAVTFFKKHPTLTTLNILENTSRAKFIKDEGVLLSARPSLVLFPGSLPNMTNLRVPRYIFDAIHPDRTPRLDELYR